MGELLISVIIPVYNCKRYIEQAIKSVINQTIKTEIIIIDDASDDGTDLILKPYIEKDKIIYIRNNTNLGVAKSRNNGVLVAKGNYIAFLDSDDWWHKNKLKLQLELMNKTNAPFCYTGRELCAEDGTSLGQYIEIPQKITYRQLLYTNVIACSSVVVRRDIALQFPMVHDEFHEDYIMWLSILRYYKCAYGINLPLLHSRLTRAGKSRNKFKTIHMTFGVYRQIGLSKVKSFVYLLNHIVRSGVRYTKGKYLSRNIRKMPDTKV
jgi:teichuronic acid biosynthesis glycosyltransferase TuaG